MTSKALRQFIAGATNPKGNVGDFQHASRLVVDADMRLAPKTKYLYYVNFNINTNALKSLNFRYQHANEINMLVKSAELPKFQVQTETLNQYNRKRNVQTKIEYQPINIRFWDDNLGVVNQLWQNYYGYYYGDSAAAGIAGAYNQTAMKNASLVKGRFGLDNNIAMPFFRDITIYQLTKKTYQSYKLVNPLITAWQHDSMDSSNNSPAEQSMTVAYESVAYDVGAVAQGSPPGFATDHYDTTPSPISLPGGGTTTIFGPGGVLAGAEQVFSALGSGKAFDSPENFISTAITAVNTYQNAKSLTSAGARGELTNVVTRGVAALGNLRSFSFPTSQTSNPTTQAVDPNITGGIS